MKDQFTPEDHYNYIDELYGASSKTSARARFITFVVTANILIAVLFISVMINTGPMLRAATAMIDSGAVLPGPGNEKAAVEAWNSLDNEDKKAVKEMLKDSEIFKNTDSNTIGE